MNYSILSKGLAVAAASLFLSATAASAGDLFDRGSMKDAPAAAERPVFSANVGLTTDYVFRGISQTEENAAIQGGFDVTYRMFYAGVWASNLDFGGDANGNDIANIEIDLYAGIKRKWHNTEIDLGVIYYAYPSAEDAGAELDYVEFKLGLSRELTDRISIGGTLYYSPEYTGESGETMTYEATASVALGKYGRFEPSLTGTFGYVDFMDNAFDANSYAYWNAGIEVGLMDKISLDLRYWDTDTDGTHPFAGTNSDERFVATITSSW